MSKALYQQLREPEHYRQVIRYLALGVVASVVVNLLQAFGLFILATKNVEHRYFPINDKGQIVEVLGQETPGMTETKRQGWTVTQVMESMTFSFTNWERELPRAQEGFDKRTWTAFFTQLEQMGWWERIRNERVNLLTLATNAPFLVEEGFVNNRQQWVYEIELLHEWEGANGSRRGQRTIARVTVADTDISIAPSGLEITFIEVLTVNA